ncbi:MAG TPA: hypothetical protein VKZ81_13690, partial [Pseudonocardia sp.]|uniref:hypothetical protein n=1 Tax=Pseudonocardia sp. TaxID=60912 RepID=UPI002BEF9376|nr:hypothetical protein [Pseudonocardia sp.]
ARVLRGTPGAVVAGAASGFMNVTAGVGGPAISLYGLSTGWPHAPFVATVQLYFVVLNGASIVAKGWPVLAPAVWVVALGALAVGAAAGHRLTRHVQPGPARLLVAGVALLGSAATVVKALLELARP